ncbi:metalloprotease [Mariniflexile ostreae]|uniref:Metalloprotease n=1 Tax=Mariniflexile ostreae TaxID=1520892 RepID=A0ABV5FFM5_9FLAO
MSMISFGQNTIDIKAKFDIEKNQISISQTIRYHNTTSDTLKSVYLNDWNHSYSSKKTPLAKRLTDEYKTAFHFAKEEERGFTTLISLKQFDKNLSFERLKNNPDVIKVILKDVLQPHTSYTLELDYLIKVPRDKFTNYGAATNGDLNLRYWYITPAVYDGEWQYYSNKNLDDLFIPKADITIKAEFPKNYHLTSELNRVSNTETPTNKTVTLEGKDRVSSKLFLNKESKFTAIQNDSLAIISDIEEKNLELLEKILITEKITKFLSDNLGAYPHESLVLAQLEASKNPVYGLNFLPKFLKTYSTSFQYELKILKVTLQNYLENTLLINPRKDQWLFDGIQVYFLMKYVELYYPDLKFLGSMSNIWGIRSFHAASLKYNDKYILAYMLMARTNRDQILSMPKDSLLKFNENIGNKYKAGIGFQYLDDFINADVLEVTIKSFLKAYKLKPTSPKAFETYLKAQTPKDIDWFFKDYINSRSKIDFKIKNVSKTQDSVTLTIKNKRHNSMPISLYTLKNDSVISKIWVENIIGNKTLTIPRNHANKLVLNYNNVIPENNLRDNWKSLKGFFFNNKPLQFRLFKDIEDPYYNQVFFMPILEFNNIYDGIDIGIRTYNKTILRKHFTYSLEPQYSLKSKSLTGGASFSVNHFIENKNLYAIRYGLSGSYKSYAKDLFVRQVSPFVNFSFREDDNFRSNKRDVLTVRYVDIKRDDDVLNISNSTKPNYSIFNVKYLKSNNNLITHNQWDTDLEIGKTFSKIALNYEYRKLFESNRQLNLRFFTGAFLYNKTPLETNYFSFALDRPTDYLFEYNYLGRSEASGIFSQQYIDAEGGFKSKLDTPFANQWITTLNSSTTLWKYVLVYGDIGLVKNKFNSAKLVYDSGIRINLVTDYFEVYFPIYSNLGWEVGQPRYDEKIRFKFTLDPQSLLGLFRRRWY